MIWCVSCEHTHLRDELVCDADGRSNYVAPREQIGSTRYIGTSVEIPIKKNSSKICPNCNDNDRSAELDPPIKSKLLKDGDCQIAQNEFSNARSEESLDGELTRKIKSIIGICEHADITKANLNLFAEVDFDEPTKITKNLHLNANFGKFVDGNSFRQKSDVPLDNLSTIQNENPFEKTCDALDPGSQLTKGSDALDVSSQQTTSSNEFTEASRRIGELHTAMLKVMHHSERLEHLENEFRALSLNKNNDSKNNSKPIPRKKRNYDVIPAYKPFQTIEVPATGAEVNEKRGLQTDGVDKPHTSKVDIASDTQVDVSSDDNLDVSSAANLAVRSAANLNASSKTQINISSDSLGRTVIDTTMDDKHSRQIMRYALLRALQRLEDGTGYFSAKIIITEP